MSNYIKREDAMSHPFANGHYDKAHANEDFILGHECYKEWIETLPASDVVEVVRCKDCIHAIFVVDGADACACAMEYSLVCRDKDFFCAFGERVKDDG